MEVSGVFSSDSEQPINSGISTFLGIKHSTFHTQLLKCAIFAEREGGGEAERLREREGQTDGDRESNRERGRGLG